MQGPGGRPVCSDCIDPDGPPVEYICSVAGCGNKPRVIAMLDDDMTASVLVCEAHFKEIRDMAISHIELPAWLTDGSAYLTGDGNVVLRFDLGPEGD